MPGAQAQAEYEYEPSDTDPPIGTNMLLHLFENPDHADVLPILFRRFPKKKLRRLQACSQKGYSVGWGVQFVESLNGYAIFICGCLGFALCLLASILWTVLKNDVQGGFAVGAFVRDIHTSDYVVLDGSSSDQLEHHARLLKRQVQVTFTKAGGCQ
ncbi:hypothetical protein AUP68_09576 [Ilyonectria robusta]